MATEVEVEAVAAATDLAPGRSLCGGRYRLEGPLGAGGMAAVWAAHDTRLDRPVAIKILAEALASDTAFVARFRREARIAAGLSHPNLVAVYDSGQEAARPYLVMELVAGRTLAQLLGPQADPRPLPDPGLLAGALIDALEHIHAAGVVHRDVKPSNVLVGPGERVRLTDFGIAQPEDATRLTQTGMVLGTLRYLAPELVRGGEAGPRSDLYALGILLGEVLDAQPARATPALRLLATRLASQSPEARPATAAHASALLVDAGEPATTQAPAVSGRPRPPRPARADSRRPARRAWAAGILAMALAIAVLVALAAGGSSTRRPPRALPGPPPPSAPVGAQLDGIERTIRALARR